MQALDSPRDMPGIPLRAMAYVFGPRPNKRTRVTVAIELDADKLTFEPSGHSRVAHLEVGMTVENRDTGQGFERDERVAVETEDSEPAGWRSFAREFELPAGVTLTRVAVRDKASGVIGSVSQRFEIPEPSALHLSTPILTDRLASGTKGETHPEPALAVHRVFAPEGKLYCQFEVFGAARAPSHGAPDVAAGLELRNGRGQVMQNAEPMPIKADSDGRLVRMVGMSLDGLNEGSYDLVLDVRDRVSGGRLERHEPFVLARNK